MDVGGEDHHQWEHEAQEVEVGNKGDLRTLTSIKGTVQRVYCPQFYVDQILPGPGSKLENFFSNFDLYFQKKVEVEILINLLSAING